MENELPVPQLHLLSHLELLSVLSWIAGYAPDIVGKALIQTVGGARVEEITQENNAEALDSNQENS